MKFSPQFNTKNKFPWLVLALILLVTLPETFLFLFPGLIFFRSNDTSSEPNDFIELITKIIFISWSFWIVSYWITSFTPISLTHLYYAFNIVFIGIAALLFPTSSVSNFTLPRKREVLFWSILSIFIGIRFIPFFDRIVGSVGDMTQHLYMSQIIVLNNGHAETYEPVMPFHNFGEYPLGFHTLVALLTLVGEWPITRAANFLSCTIYVFIGFAIYSFLRKKFSSILSLITAVVIVSITHYPQFLNQWGSSSTALSTAFLFYAWNHLERILSGESISGLDKTMIAFLISAGFLSHLIPPIGFVFYFGILMIGRILLKNLSIHSFVKPLLPIILLVSILMAPYLFNFNYSVFDQSKDHLVSGHHESFNQIRSVFTNIQPAWLNPGLDIAGVFAFLFGPVFTLWMLFLAFLQAKNWIQSKNSESVKKESIDFFGSMILFVLLVLLFQYQITPISHLFQIERVHYFLLLPSSILIANQLSRAYERGLTKVWIGTGIVLFLGTLINGFLLRQGSTYSHYTEYKRNPSLVRLMLRDLFFGSTISYSLDKVNAGVSHDDLKAFEWIKNHVNENAIFLTNPGDGGPLITSLALRKITNPHGMDLWHKKELKIWQQFHPPTHIYIGKNTHPIYPTPWRKSDLLKDPKRYQLLYDSGGCSLLKIL